MRIDPRTLAIFANIVRNSQGFDPYNTAYCWRWAEHYLRNQDQYCDRLTLWAVDPHLSYNREHG